MAITMPHGTRRMGHEMPKASRELVETAPHRARRIRCKSVNTATRTATFITIPTRTWINTVESTDRPLLGMARR